MMYYAVARHGTAGLGWSYGFAEVVPAEAAPRADQTTTISGPHTKCDAERIAADWEASCQEYRETQDAR